jgi:multiple antibiotic resistance protein
MFVGSYILDFFGLSLPVVQVGGGLLIMSFGWRFLHQGDEDVPVPDAMTWRPEELARRAFYPSPCRSRWGRA